MAPQACAVAFALLAAPILAGCVQTPAPGSCDRTRQDIVMGIVDGDTVDLADCGRIRLALIDTPEWDEEGHEQAAAFTAAVCPVGTEATMDPDAGQPLDTTGTRRVAVLSCAGVNLNEALLEGGHAVVLVEFCSISEFGGAPWAQPECEGW